MGEVRVPLAAKWQAQTQRAVDNFPVSGQSIDRALVRALALLKRAAALENAQLGVIDERVADAIAEVALEVAEGQWDAEFPIDVFQTGSGTSSNMNMNEVLATLASDRLGERVHPNDQVNASQSSNDLFPSAIHVAASSGDLELAHPGSRAPGRSTAAEIHAVCLGGESGPHAPHGRHPCHPGPGVRGLRGCHRTRHRAPVRLPRPGGRAPAWGHCGGDRVERSFRVRRRGHKKAGGGARAAAQRGQRPFRGARVARRAGGGIGCRSHRGRVAVQMRHRYPVDGERPACRAWPRCASPIFSPGAR